MDVLDVLGLRFALRCVPVIRILRRVARSQIHVDRRRSKICIEVPQEILVSIDIDPDLVRIATAVGSVTILAPQSVSILRIVTTVRIDAWKDDDIDLLDKRLHFGSREVLASVADSSST